MNNPFKPRIGGVMSADIAVPQHESVKQFYASILNTGDSPLWRRDLMNNHGMPIIGIGARSPEYSDLPLHWMPHIQVADVAQSVDKAIELGGNELLHGKKDDGTSQWAVLHDPNGAAFGVIPVVSGVEQPSKHGEKDKRGNISWLDLTVPNATVIRDFYQKVIGWSVQDVKMEDANGRYADYSMLDADGDAVAGICHARGMNMDQPPNWILYLPVSDLNESLRRVRDGGGKVLKKIAEGDGEYVCAVIQDPVGTSMALVPG